MEPLGDPLNLGALGQLLMNKLTDTGILGLAGFCSLGFLQQSPGSTLAVAGADIQATGNVTATATTKAQLRLRTDSLWIGVNYGRSSAWATLTIAGRPTSSPQARSSSPPTSPTSCGSAPSSRPASTPA